MKYELTDQVVQTIVSALDVMARLNPLASSETIGPVLIALKNPISEKEQIIKESAPQVDAKTA